MSIPEVTCAISAQNLFSLLKRTALPWAWKVKTEQYWWPVSMTTHVVGGTQGGLSHWGWPDAFLLGVYVEARGWSWVSHHVYGVSVFWFCNQDLYWTWSSLLGYTGWSTSPSNPLVSASQHKDCRWNRKTKAILWTGLQLQTSGDHLGLNSSPRMCCGSRI